MPKRRTKARPKKADKVASANALRKSKKVGKGGGKKRKA